MTCTCTPGRLYQRRSGLPEWIFSAEARETELAVPARNLRWSHEQDMKTKLTSRARHHAQHPDIGYLDPLCHVDLFSCCAGLSAFGDVPLSTFLARAGTRSNRSMEVAADCRIDHCHYWGMLVKFPGMPRRFLSEGHRLIKNILAGHRSSGGLPSVVLGSLASWQRRSSANFSTCRPA